jgi:hypothetical protein
VNPGGAYLKGQRIAELLVIFNHRHVHNLIIRDSFLDSLQYDEGFRSIHGFFP